MQPILNIEFLAMLATLGLFVGITSFMFGRLPLKPLLDAHRNPLRPTQFLLTDIYALLVQVMIAGFLITKLQGDENGADRFKLTQAALITPLLVFWWFIGVRWLSRAGVQKVLRRLEVLLVAVPFAFGGPLAFLIIMIVLFTQNDAQIRNPNDPVTLAERFRVWMLLSATLAILYMYFSGCAQLVERALRSRDEKLSNNNSFE